MDDLESIIQKLEDKVPNNKEKNEASYKCKKCKDTGIIISDDMLAGERCPCVKQKAIEKKFKKSQLPRHMLNIRFEHIKTSYYSMNIEPIKQKTYRDLAKIALEESKKFVKSYIKGKDTTGLTFIGGCGSGKTFFAAAIANNLLKSNITVLFVVVPDLLNEIKATYQNSSEYTEQVLINTAREAPVLILDDLGAHKYTDWVQERLFQIINYRLNNKLPIIVTTNIELGEMGNHIGERLTSRIIEATQILRLHTDYDIRKLKRQESKK